MELAGYAAVVLAGGAGRRMGGGDKPALPVAGRSMLDRVLDAVADAAPRVVVAAPGRPLPDGVLATREDPPGAGPVAAAAAGLALVPAEVPAVALLAADLPLLTAAAIGVLRGTLSGPPGAARRGETGVAGRGDTGAAGRGETGVAGRGDTGAAGRGETGAAGGRDHIGVAVFVDGDGQRQILCGLWRREALATALAGLGAAYGTLADLPMRLVWEAVPVAAEVTWPDGGPPPWYDCDTPAAVRAAEEWIR